MRHFLVHIGMAVSLCVHSLGLSPTIQSTHPDRRLSSQMRCSEEALALTETTAMNAKSRAAMDTRGHVKAFLELHFTQVEDRSFVLMLFGDYLVQKPHLMMAFGTLLTLFSEEKPDRRWNSRHYLLAMDWLRGLDTLCKDIRLEELMKIFLDPESLLVRHIVSDRMGFYAILLAHWVHRKVQALPLDQQERYFVSEFASHRSQYQQSRKHRFYSEFIYNESSLTKLPIRAGDRFMVWISHEAPRDQAPRARRIFLGIKAGKAAGDLHKAQRSKNGENCRTSNMVLMLDVEPVDGSLMVHQHQPLLAVDDEICAAFPQATRLIEKAESQWASILNDRMEELAAAGWPRQTPRLAFIEIASGGHLLQRWPGMASQSAMNAYVHYPFNEGFQPVEVRGTSPRTEQSGFWIWRKSIHGPDQPPNRLLPIVQPPAEPSAPDPVLSADPLPLPKPEASLLLIPQVLMQSVTRLIENSTTVDAFDARMRILADIQIGSPGTAVKFAESRPVGNALDRTLLALTYMSVGNIECLLLNAKSAKSRASFNLTFSDRPPIRPFLR